jgi:ElaB/YqjD/DUF883 family membrane-anchored ribosome-binding protein
MKKRTKLPDTEFSDLAEGARALMAATANVSGHQVQRARKRLAAAMQRGKDAGEDMIDATTEAAGEGLDEIRDRINAGLDHGKEIYDDVHDEVVDCAKATDRTVRQHPYQVMGIALGVGALVGFILSYRNSRNGH